MENDDRMIHALLDMGELYLRTGAEVYRVEDTLKRMGRAYGAQEMNVFVITSSIIITLTDAHGQICTQTRRVYQANGNDFARLTAVNALSREFCASPCSPDELSDRIRAIRDQSVPCWIPLIGCILGAGAFAVFFGGTLWDGAAACLAGLLIWALQRWLAPICMNDVVFTLFASLFSGLLICGEAALFPVLHTDMVMIGAIMLLIPGVMMTNSIRDILLGDTLSGIIRLIQALLLAGVLAIGFIAALVITGGIRI